MNSRALQWLALAEWLVAGANKNELLSGADYYSTVLPADDVSPVCNSQRRVPIRIGEAAISAFESEAPIGSDRVE